MKKVLTAILAAAMALSLLSGCAGSKPTETTSPDQVEGTVEELLNEIVDEQPVEFDGGVETIDLTDTSEEGKWAIKSSTGLDNAGVLTEAAVFADVVGCGKWKRIGVFGRQGVGRPPLSVGFGSTLVSVEASASFRCAFRQTKLPTAG